jgi:muconolactone delta-isomerase
MQFLTLTRRRTETFSDADFAQHVEAESQRVRTLYTEGTIRQIWKRGDMPGACILMEVENEAQAREAFASLPLAQLGMLEVVAIIPLQPYHGFGPR